MFVLPRNMPDLTYILKIQNLNASGQSFLNIYRYGTPYTQWVLRGPILRTYLTGKPFFS